MVSKFVQTVLKMLRCTISYHRCTFFIILSLNLRCKNTVSVSIPYIINTMRSKYQENV